MSETTSGQRGPLNILSAQPSRRDEVVHVSAGDVDLALAQVAQAYPQLDRCMTVARAMLTRLDTIRDEAKLGAMIAKGHADAARPEVASAELSKLVDWLGRWGKQHELML